MLRLLSDESVHGGIVRGLRRQAPELDVIRVHDVGLIQTPDPQILEWAAKEGRVVITADVSNGWRRNRKSRGESSDARRVGVTRGWRAGQEHRRYSLGGELLPDDDAWAGHLHPAVIRDKTRTGPCDTCRIEERKYLMRIVESHLKLCQARAPRLPRSGPPTPTLFRPATETFHEFQLSSCKTRWARPGGISRRLSQQIKRSTSS